MTDSTLFNPEWEIKAMNDSGWPIFPSSRVTGLALSPDGFAYVYGYTPYYFGDSGNSGGYDAFLLQYSEDGSRLRAITFGNSWNDYTTGIEVSNAGEIYAAYGYSLNGKPGTYLAKFDNKLSRVWTIGFDDYVGDSIEDIAVDGDGCVYLAASVEGSQSVYKYTRDGELVWSQALPGGLATTIDVSEDGIYVAGLSRDPRTESGD
jgi:hypothetical protein